MRRKFWRLAEYFAQSTREKILLGISEIASIAGVPLEKSAWTYSAYWANDRTHSIAHAWLENGYREVAVDLEAGTVSFEKGEA